MVTGAEGQLGQELCRLLGARLAWSGGRAALDIRDRDAVRRRLEDVRPDVVVNGAAYNAVDRAEVETDAALAVNAAGPHHLAVACRAVGAVLVHVSTDYVFDGRLDRPYREDDPPHPLSAYGVSKLAGELLVRAAGGDWLIVRTSAVFGGQGSRAKGGSFVERMVARARGGESLRVVDDQVVAPTYVPDLARAILGLAEIGARGIVHATGGGQASWHELAVASLAEAGVPAVVTPIASRDLGAPAARPRRSVLDNGRAISLGLPPPRHWREALHEMLAEA